MNFSGGFNQPFNAGRMNNSSPGGFNNSDGGAGFQNSNRGGFNRRGRGRGGGRGSKRGGHTGGFNDARLQNQPAAQGGFHQAGGFADGHGAGGPANRGRGRGGSRTKRPTGLVFADNILSFNMAADAHTRPGQQGVTTVTSWDESSTVFTGGIDGSVKMYNVNDASSVEQSEGKEVSALCQFSGWLFVGIVNPGGNTDVGFVKAYNFTNQPVQSFNLEIDSSFPAAHHARVTSICAGNGMLFTAGEDFAIRGWSLQDGGSAWRLVGSLGGQQAHSCPVRKISFVANNLFSGGDDGSIKVWSGQGVLVKEFNAHSGRVTGICGWSGANQNVLLTCSHDSTVKVWDMSTGEISIPANPVFVYPPKELHAKPKPLSCMLTHVLRDGTHVLIVGTVDGSIRLLDLPDFCDLGYTRGQQRNFPITSMTVVQPNNLLFAGSMNGQLNCFKFIA